MRKISQKKIEDALKADIRGIEKHYSDYLNGHAAALEAILGGEFDE